MKRMGCSQQSSSLNSKKALMLHAQFSKAITDAYCTPRLGKVGSGTFRPLYRSGLAFLKEGHGFAVFDVGIRRRVPNPLRVR